MVPVDLKPLVDLAFTFVDGLIITVLLPVLAAYLLNKLHIDATNALGARVLTAAQNGASQALGALQGVADRSATLEVKNKLVASAAAYVVATVPDALQTLGVTPANLNALVLAKIHAALPEVATPATPVATAKGRVKP